MNDFHVLFIAIFSVVCFPVQQALATSPSDNVTFDVQLSESSVFNGDIVFAKLTLFNAGATDAVFETFDPHRNVCARTRDYTGSSNMIVGHVPLSEPGDRQNGETRLKPGQSESHVVMLRFITFPFSLRANEIRTVDVEFTARLFRTHNDLSSDRDAHLGQLQAKIIGQIIRVPILSELCPLRQAGKRSSRALLAQIHGGLIVTDLYETQFFTPFPGLLRQAVFPLTDLDRWRVLRDKNFKPETVLHRLVSISLAYQEIVQYAKSANSELATKVKRLLVNAPPIERWWLLNQIRADLVKRGYDSFAQEIKRTLVTFPLAGMAGFGASDERHHPAENLKIEIELSDDHLVDGDVLFCEVSYRNESMHEKYVRHFFLEESLEVRFPSGVVRGSRIVTELDSDLDGGIRTTHLEILLKPGQSFSDIAMVRVDALDGDLEIQQSLLDILPHVELTLKVYSSTIDASKKKSLFNIGEVIGKRISLPMHTSIAKTTPLGLDTKTLIHGGHRLIPSASADVIELKEFSGLIRSSAFPFKQLPEWKLLRKTYLRDQSALARLIDISIACQEIAIQNENWKTQHDEIVKLLQDSPRIERLWLYSKLFDDLATRMRTTEWDQIEAYKLKLETTKKLAQMPSIDSQK